MSTIKSSDEHLTLNADGSSKDIKFQANGVEKASISSAGAFTSTTIDATKLTGNLPAISGANLTGLSSFDPDGAVTINDSGADVDFRVESDTDDYSLFVQGSDGKVGIGTDAPTSKLQVKDTVTGLMTLTLENGNTAGHNCAVDFTDNYGSGNIRARIASMVPGDDATGDLRFYTRQSSSLTKTLTLTQDGRGVSEFTTRAWCSFNGTGTIAINDSHNVSSITDLATGRYRVTFSSALSNSYPATTVSGVSSGNFAVNPCLDDNPSDSKVDIRCIQEQNSSFNIVDTSLVTVMVNGD